MTSVITVTSLTYECTLLCRRFYSDGGGARAFVVLGFLHDVTCRDEIIMKTLTRFVSNGKLKGGKVLYKNPRWVAGMLQQFDDCNLSITFEKRRKHRSKEQMGYLWGVVYPEISEHTGHTPEELHEIYKAQFLRKKVNWRGAQMTVLTSTGQLTSNEMAEFITNVILDAGEMGISVPPPDPEYQWH